MSAPDHEPLPPAIDAPVGFWLRVLYVLGPFAATAAVLGVIYLFAGLWMLHEVWITGTVSLLGAGTTVIFGKAALGDATKLGTWQLAYIVMYVNAVSTFFYTYNLDLLQRVPKVGPTLRRARRNAAVMLKQRPWIRRWAVIGVGLFVITPLPGSGALGGALVGRIVGVSKRATFISVSIAGVVVSLAYALLANELEQALNRLQQFTPPWVRIAVFLIAALVLVYVMTKLVRWLASHPPEGLKNAASKDVSSADVSSEGETTGEVDVPA